MSGYLELVEYICLVISIGNFIAIGFTLKKRNKYLKQCILLIIWELSLYQILSLDGRLVCG